MSLLDLLCPTRCEGCGRPDGLVCVTCRLPLTAAPFEHRPSPCPPGLPPVWVVADYEGSTRELLLGAKERGAPGLAAVLADPLAAAVRAVVAARPGPIVLVPVPSLPAAVRRRGDDVVGLMSRRASRRLRVAGIESRVVPALVHRRAVADSAGLSAAQRAANLAGAFSLRPGMADALRPYPVVIADDLVTTGATLSEATRALRGAGVVVRGAAAIAATRRRTSRSGAPVGW